MFIVLSHPYILLRRSDMSQRHRTPTERLVLSIESYKHVVPPGRTTHLSFNVERLNNANKIARIKNRKTIFDSFQSCISK